MDKAKLPAIRYSAAEINNKRAAVRSALLAQSGNISGGEIGRIATADLSLLFGLYDAVFLKGYFQSRFRGKITFSLSTRMTRNAGKLTYPRNIKTLPADEEKYDLKIGTDFFFKYYQLNREKVVNGIKTTDALQALQLVFEHELCHLIEMHCYRESSCRRERFQAMAQNIFGHTECYHQLPSNSEIAGSRYGFHAGDRVRFKHDDTEYSGFIYRINKRATVMVPDKEGLYQDQQGNSYSKWYVPLSRLEK